ncbi:MAG: mechanosensitive ion channel domain-containing protein [Elainellaceae cyanobacterium]
MKPRRHYRPRGQARRRLHLWAVGVAVLIVLAIPAWSQTSLARASLAQASLAQVSITPTDDPAIDTAQPLTAKTAPIIVDGRILFEIKGVGELTAQDRARQVNQALAQQVRHSEDVTIEVVRDDTLIYLRSKGSGDSLVTVTQSDVTPLGRQPISQGREWARTLQQSLQQAQRERAPSYLRQAITYSLTLVGGAIALQLGLQVLGRVVNRRLTRWFEYSGQRFIDWEKPATLFWRLGLIGITVGLWLTVAFYVTDVFPLLRGWRYAIGNVLDAKIINLGSGTYSAIELLLLLGLIVGVWFASNVVTQLFRFHVLNRARIEKRVQDILSVLIHYALIFLGVVVLLQIWGIDLSSIAILASVLGVGIGFGVQNITNNFISGFIIMLESPIQSGDFINVGDLVGTVEKIGARSTEIRTLDQVTIIIPNSRFLESEVINWSHGNPVSRLHVPVSVAYGSDIDHVKTALLEAIRRHPEVLLRPAPEVWFQGFGDSALDFEIMVWTGEPRKQFRVKSDLNYEIEASLRRYGIEIPFPQRDLHLRSPQLDELIVMLKRGLESQPDSTLDATED